MCSASSRTRTSSPMKRNSEAQRGFRNETRYRQLRSQPAAAVECGGVGGCHARAACCSPRNSAVTSPASARGPDVVRQAPPSRVRPVTWPSIRSPAQLDGRKGSFLLQHSGSMNRGVPTLSIMVVPDSGTDELAGSRGTLSINIIDGKHFYDFIYSIPRAEARLKAACGERDATSMPAANDKQLAGVARPPVGMARAQPRRRGNPSHGFRRARCRAARRRLAASWPRRNPHAAARRRRALSTAAGARGAVARHAGALVHLGVAAARALRARAARRMASRSIAC